MIGTDRQLVALHCSVWKNRRIVFRYKKQRWEFFECLRPWDIREALRISLERIEKAVSRATTFSRTFHGAMFRIFCACVARRLGSSMDHLPTSHSDTQPGPRANIIKLLA